MLGMRNEERLPIYHRFDIRASRQVDLPFGSLRFFLEIYNLLNRKNVCCVEGFAFFADGDGSVRVERREDAVIGWIPSFGIALDF